MRPDEQEKFRNALRHELLRRCKTNPRYSLRSFSRALGVESSFLSKILSGKRGITYQTVDRLSPNLGFRQIADESTAFAPLSEDKFQLIANWYHFAILELFTVAGFKPTTAYISKRLGISPIEASDAFERLERLGLIGRRRGDSRQSKGWVLLKGSNTTTATPGSTAALRELQRQILRQALDALEEIPPEQRDQSAITMAIDSSALPRARQAIKEFRRSLCRDLQRTGTRNSVYQLSISFFPITRGGQ